MSHLLAESKKPHQTLANARDWVCSAFPNPLAAAWLILNVGQNIMNFRNLMPVGVILLVSALVGGCTAGLFHAPDGFAIVREHSLFVPRSNPPIRSELDFTITEVDGGQVAREKMLVGVDMTPGVLVSAGRHQFKTRVRPHVRSFEHPAREETFVASVESGKVYELVDKDSRPILIEALPWSPKR